jgi:hypothetical protein
MTEWRRTAPGDEAEPRELTSWKEIATHLQVSTKTAQRYETERGLPVRRVGTRVTIGISELEEWKATQTRGGGWHSDVRLLQRGIIVLVAVLAIFVAGAAIYWYRQLPGVPVSAVSEGSLLYIKDAAGKTVWTHTFDLPIGRFDAHSKTEFHLHDLESDGSVEAVGVWKHSRRDSEGWAVQCFEADGRLRWSLKMEDRVRTLGGQELGPPFVVRDMLVFDSPELDRTKWTAVLFVHVADVPATLVIVDHKGRRRGQYWHVGHLNALELFDADGDGTRELVAGGVRHGIEQAVLVAFEAGRVGGTNTMPDGHARTILDKGPSTEKRTGYFARSEVSKLSNLFNYVSDLAIVNGRLSAQVFEKLEAPEAYLRYEFEPGLKPTGITLAVAFLAVHRTQDMRNRFDENFPEREVARLKREFRTERGN